MRSGSVIDPTLTEFLTWLYDDGAVALARAETERFNCVFDADFTTHMHALGFTLTRDKLTLTDMQRHFIADAERRLTWANA